MVHFFDKEGENFTANFCTLFSGFFSLGHYESGFDSYCRPVLQKTQTITN